MKILIICCFSGEISPYIWYVTEKIAKVFGHPPKFRRDEKHPGVFEKHGRHLF
jgi:hypothetical protein